MMKISYYAYTNKGGRPNNEDSICCGLQNRRGVFVLADGLGGHSSGERWLPALPPRPSGRAAPEQRTWTAKR